MRWSIVVTTQTPISPHHLLVSPLVASMSQDNTIDLISDDGTDSMPMLDAEQSNGGRYKPNPQSRANDAYIHMLATGAGRGGDSSSAGIRRVREEAKTQLVADDNAADSSGDEEGDASSGSELLREAGYPSGRNPSGEIWAAEAARRKDGSRHTMPAHNKRRLDTDGHNARVTGNVVQELPSTRSAKPKKQKRSPTAVADNGDILYWKSGKWQVTHSTCSCSKCLCEGSVAQMVGRVLRGVRGCNRGLEQRERNTD